MAKRLKDYSTPFEAVKSAPQDIDFAIDPSFGLTRRRYGWYSNNTLFDDTHFGTVPGGITLSTSATASDSARIRSAYAGQYVSQTLAVPGEGMHITSGVSELGGQYKLDNGIVAVGAGWHNGSSGGWDVGGTIETFIGLKWDTDGLQAICVSDGSHVAGSPVDQTSFNVDPFDGSGDTGNVLDPTFGYIYNQPYTWYNEGAIVVGVVDPADNIFWPMHRFEGVDGAPSLDRPNLPPMVLVDNDGTAASTSVTLGGMQYSRYGSTNATNRQRRTPLSRITSGNYIATQAVTSNNAVDPPAAPGNGILGIQRKSDVRDLEFLLDGLKIVSNSDIYLLLWDEWDYSTATGANSNLRDPHPINSAEETGLQVDSEFTSYTPTTWSSRGYTPIEGGGKNDISLQLENVELRVPIDATRVITAVHNGSTADITFMRQTAIEGL